MIISMPVANNQLCMHFGHCQVFAFFEVDENEKKVLNKRFSPPPPHEPGVLPAWIKEQGAELVITGGMGIRAQRLFNEAGISVITGAPPGNPEEIVLNFLNKTLQTGDNVCDH